MSKKNEQVLPKNVSVWVGGVIPKPSDGGLECSQSSVGLAGGVAKCFVTRTRCFELTKQFAAVSEHGIER